MYYWKTKDIKEIGNLLMDKVKEKYVANIIIDNVLDIQSVERCNELRRKNEKIYYNGVSKILRLLDEASNICEIHN